MRTKLALLVDVLLVWTHFVILMFAAFIVLVAAHGGHMREDELPKGFAQVAIFVWTLTLLGWGVAAFILSRRLNRRLGLSSGGIFLTMLLVGVPVYGYLYYRRNLRWRLFGPPEEAVAHHVPRPQPAWLRSALDVWLTLQPGWMTVLYWYAFTEDARYAGPVTPETALATTCIAVGLLGWWAVLFWCASMVDDIDHGWRKALWYALILILAPFGPTLCYFTHLRERVFPRTPDAGLPRGHRQVVDHANRFE